MAGRVPTPDFNPSINFRPAASPVDTFVRPAEDNSTRALVDALSGLQPQLKGYLTEAREEKKQSDIDEGRAAALKNALEWGAAVSQGLVDPQSSEWFMKAYKEQYGRVLGQKVIAEAEAEWFNSEGFNSGDTASFEPFADSVRKKYITDGMDADTLAGLIPVLDNGMSSLRSTHVRNSAEIIRKNALENWSTDAANQIDEIFKTGSFSSEADYQAIYDKLGVLEAHAKVAGYVATPSDLNNIMVDLLITKAVETNDTRYLKVLENHRGNMSAGLTLYGREKIAGARSAIQTSRNAAYARSVAADAAALTLRQNEAEGEQVALIMEAVSKGEDPNTVALGAKTQALLDEELLGASELSRILNLQANLAAQSGSKVDKPLSNRELVGEGEKYRAWATENGLSPQDPINLSRYLTQISTYADVAISDPDAQKIMSYANSNEAAALASIPGWQATTATFYKNVVGASIDDGAGALAAVFGDSSATAQQAIDIGIAAQDAFVDKVNDLLIQQKDLNLPGNEGARGRAIEQIAREVRAEFKPLVDELRDGSGSTSNKKTSADLTPISDTPAVAQFGEENNDYFLSFGGASGSISVGVPAELHTAIESYVESDDTQRASVEVAVKAMIDNAMDSYSAGDYEAFYNKLLSEISNEYLRQVLTDYYLEKTNQ